MAKGGAVDKHDNVVYALVHAPRVELNRKGKGRLVCDAILAARTPSQGYKKTETADLF